MLAALVLTGAAAWADAPRRVVSLNVCTDQMALLLADPGQIAALSPLADDPRSAVYADRARGIAQTDGSAEDVVLRQPDLVLAGSFTTRATVEMLTGLGLRVEIFPPVSSLEDARANLRRMGRLLGQEARAEAEIARLDAALSALPAPRDPRPRAIFYYALGGTAGPGTLPGDILVAAGIHNIAAELGMQGFGGRLPLERLVLSDPDLILVGEGYEGHARATELLEHPALQGSAALRRIGNGTAWVCETPELARAVAAMVDLRRDWEAAR